MFIANEDLLGLDLLQIMAKTEWLTKKDTGVIDTVQWMWDKSSVT